MAVALSKSTEQYSSSDTNDEHSQKKASIQPTKAPSHSENFIDSPTVEGRKAIQKVRR